ncbi:hypothetical protein F5Y00DRAFT_248520 [Daldinia vernicosa]|uniref:uncharacterized protein n=1 Tax=Daldinia vernicosa TaxID=114800 RepID=UPI0020079202|nr:uncharacterized protein F5Y00DRAFT_248520 [Daldinia vernicosa]KAI0844498.1 hypothetical protein F5Y00DRAFT_248520 [Daldinia vernicosa]
MSSGKAGKAWSPQEKLEFLLQVIDRVHPSGKGIPFDELKMPGRTPRSLRHTWSNLRAEAAAYRNGSKNNDNDSGEEAEAGATTNGSRGKKKTPTKSTDSPRRGSRQRTQKRTYSDWVSDDEEDKVSVKKARLSSDDEKEADDSNADAVAVTKSRPVRSTRGAKNGEPKVKLEEPVDADDPQDEGEV